MSVLLLQELKNKVLNQEKITREEALALVDVDLDELTEAANEIRESICGNHFDMCAVMSVKGGRCSEDCKFCSQNKCSTAEVPTFAVRDRDYVVEDAKLLSGLGISHYCQVASGRRMSRAGVDQIVENVKGITESTDLTCCVSLGLLDRDDLLRLKAAGVKRVHNNLETSEAYFTKVCTSHTYEEKKKVLSLIHEVGLELCSGGIFGIGESWEDRIDMALTLREYEPKSVPVNILNPVKGTEMGEREIISEDELRRIMAIYRFIIPRAYIRLAAGRDYLEDTGIKCFLGGSNASITGNMVTVKGVSIEKDLLNIKEIGYTL